ncbi:MAG TPA: hypothetical protein VFY65_17500 [Longimicrobium sp.]|nr:hypothetical protein [Longimicrobium sp.]
MTATDRATRHVVDRCPSCGVEHDVRVHACEACDTPLRPWCRVHGGEMGWLDGPACPRCAEAAAPPPRPAPAVPAPVIDAPILDEILPAAVPALTEAPPAVVAAGAKSPQRPDAGVMFMILFFTVAAGAFGGMVLSAPFVFGTAIHLDTMLMFIVAGGVLGVLFGVYCCRLYLAEIRAKAGKP